MRRGKGVLAAVSKRQWTTRWQISFRVNKANHHIFLLIVIACYFLTGMETSPTVSHLPGQRNPENHSTSQDRGRNDHDGDRPFWTNHKHEPEKLRVVVPPVALHSDLPSEKTEHAFLAFAPSVLSALLVRHADIRAGRAPPALTN